MSEFKWISVKDELPYVGNSTGCDEEIVLIGHPGTEHNDSKYEIGTCDWKGVWRNLNNRTILGVTHWSHIPEPKSDELIAFEEWAKNRCMVQTPLCWDAWMAAIEWASKRESSDKP